MDFHMSMSDMWLGYMVARNMNSSLSWSVLPHLPLFIKLISKADLKLVLCIIVNVLAFLDDFN